MSKKLLITVLYAPFILLLWMCVLFYGQSTRKEIRVSITGYDPRDLFSGHYIEFQINWDKTDCSQFDNGICQRNDFCEKMSWGKLCHFYIPEKYAKQLDALFRKERNNIKFEVIYSYKSGRKAIAKKLLINEQEWRDYAKAYFKNN